ncbi:MAG: arsenic efflux protein [Clostridia bacterium]|nr:arsenic efflux protein [Clostridia bacterium]
MSHYWHVILEALIHTARVLPFLFIVYYLIELFEFKCAKKIQENKFLKGKASPVFGSLIGCIPQCGFSVISTDLYAHRAISVGALIAVYIATSDEAIPLLITNIRDWESAGKLFALIGIKILVGILVGYLAIWLHKKIFKNKLNETHHNHEHRIVEHTGCCHHDVESKSFDWLHPMLHCLKISAFILIINMLFGFITHIWVGEEALAEFMGKGIYLQPILAMLIGLIPNCASSVVLTQLYISSGLTFGALLTGLCVNAGLGLVFLLKENKRPKENIFILSMLVVPSLILGYIFTLIL